MKSTIRKMIAIMLIAIVTLLTACATLGIPIKAAEIGGNVELDGYGEYISNDELGKLVSHGGYISKKEYAEQLADDSVGASYNPSFAGCYDTNGYQITVRRAMAGQYVGESALLIYVNGSRAYCIQPGAALNTGSSLTQTTSSGVWASLSANQKEAVNTALCYGREGNFPNIKGSSSINSNQCYIATQLIIWEIINGERNATAPYSLNGNGYLSMYCVDGHNGNIANAYHKIENAKLHEVSTLLEYNISRDVSFTVKDTPDVQTVKMINRKKTGQIIINKFDGSGQPIVGAQWKVYRKDNSELKFYRVSEGYFTYSESGTVTTLSTANISLTAVNMPFGEYYLVEEIPPSGKMSYGRKIPFTIAPDNTETLNLTINVKDNNIIIPNTGSNGRVLYNAVGLFSFTAALAVFIYHKKNKIYQSRTR